MCWKLVAHSQYPEVDNFAGTFTERILEERIVSGHPITLLKGIRAVSWALEMEDYQSG